MNLRPRGNPVLNPNPLTRGSNRVAKAKQVPSKNPTLNFQEPEVPKQATEHPSEGENTSTKNSLEEKLDKLATAVASLTSRMQNLEENTSRASNMQSVMQMTPIQAPPLSVDPMSFLLHQQLMQSQNHVPRLRGPHETQ